VELSGPSGELPAPFVKPVLPTGPILGLIWLTGSASIYGAFGVTAFPRQEWLLELLASAVFLIPVLNLLRGRGSFSTAVRWLGLMLLAHSIWDALHWPELPVVLTPIDPRLARLCPTGDIVLGLWLVVRGR
jgi:hypothetical protein